MTFVEVAAAIWVTAVIMTAGLFGWSEAVRSLTVTANQRAADDCADTAAETWTAGKPPTTQSTVDGLSCTVKLIPPASGEEAVMTIVAQVANAKQVLRIPNGPL